jgi:outer membrane protein
MIRILVPAALLATSFAASSTPAQAQDTPTASKEPIRVRAGLGAQATPRFPGSRDTGIGPYPDFAVTRGSKPFEYEAPDEPFGFPVLRQSGIEVGPAITFEGKRSRRDIGAPMDEVGFSLEAGGFVQFWLNRSVRLRAEARRGLTGHRSFVGSVGADYVIRDGDKFVFSVGPRVGLSERKYQTAYFGVNAREAAATGLPAYRPGGGVHALGAVAGGNVALDDRWGLVGYARYDRLVGDAGNSPFIAAYGKRDQFSAGLGVTYIIGRR